MHTFVSYLIGWTFLFSLKYLGKPVRGRAGRVVTLPSGEKIIAICSSASVQCLIKDKTAHFRVLYRDSAGRLSYCLISVLICHSCQVDGLPCVLANTESVSRGNKAFVCREAVLDLFYFNS